MSTFASEKSFFSLEKEDATVKHPFTQRLALKHHTFISPRKCMIFATLAGAILLPTAVLVFTRSDLMEGIYRRRRNTRRAMELPDVEASSPENALRDTLMVQQEALLVKLAKAQYGNLEDGTQHDLLKHLETLQKDLKVQSILLKEEKAKRVEAEEQVREAWGNFQLSLSQMEGIERLHRADLSRLFQTILVERFGEGPHYVRFEVSMPHHDDVSSQSSFFTAEMAPVHIMPASILVFLEQVNTGYWDNTSFFLNSALEIGAHPVYDNNDKTKQMESKGLAHAPLLEYSDNYPHLPYTFGYDGDKKRPGPNFYINKRNNVDSNRGNPCFAQVVSGETVIDSIGELAADAKTSIMNVPVKIVSARIVKKVVGLLEEPGKIVFQDASQSTVHEHADQKATT
jgi:cyclophilin family peptidyl-prolyl cis-trans isomerase